MSFSLGNERLHPLGEDLAEQLDATRHMGQPQIGDVSRWRYGLIESAELDFVTIEIRQFRPMWTSVARFDDATCRNIFHHPKLRLQARIIGETLANQITAKAIVKQNWQKQRKSPLSPFESL